MTSLYLNLYEKRYDYDCNSQPKFSRHYEDIDGDLKRFLSKDNCHPYEVRPDVNFTDNSCYMNGDETWFDGQLLKKDKYVYRIDNLHKLLVKNKKNVVNKSNLRKKHGLRDFNINQLDQAEVPKLFNSLQTKIKNWTSLTDLLLEYSTPRQITWWTNENILIKKEPESLMDFAHKLGLATNWINKYSVVVRCNIEKFLKNRSSSDIKVPSVIDAYNSPIFFSQPQRENPKFGMTINLKNIGEFGCKEFIIRNVELDTLDFQIIKIPDIVKTAYDYGTETDELYDQIISLY